LSVGCGKRCPTNLFKHGNSDRPDIELSTGNELAKAHAMAKITNDNLFIFDSSLFSNLNKSSRPKNKFKKLKLKPILINKPKNKINLEN
jgi:hypothetical protein